MMSIGGEGTFTLGDVLKVGETYDPNSDCIYTIDSETGDGVDQLVYYNDKEAEKFGGAGWYDYQSLTPFNDEPFDIGTGFQGSFAGNALTFISSGEVCKDGYSVDFTDSYVAYPVNATGRIVTWSEMSVTGDYNPDSSCFYTVDPETGDGVDQLVYYTEEIAGKFGGAGWYDYQFLTPFNETEILVGDGVQSSTDGSEFTLNFPGLQ